MVDRRHEGLGAPSSPFEIPEHVINLAANIQSFPESMQPDSIAILYRGISGVYTNLLAEANAAGMFRAGDEGQEVKNLGKDYALEVFRQPDRQISALRLSMAVEGQFGHIYFLVRSGVQMPGYVEVRDRSTRTNDNGIAVRSNRKLMIHCEDGEIVEFELDGHTNGGYKKKADLTETP